MRKPKDIKIDNLTLEEIIEKHQHWLNKDCEGWKQMRADLSDVDLSNADLVGANLYGAYLDSAYLYGANLSDADLRNADLRNADLRNADLSAAKLHSANLYDADLSSANLKGAYLCDANLRSADLKGADLTGANLRGANLYGTNLKGTIGKRIEYRKGKVLTKSIIGYEKCKDGIIATLKIPRGSIVFSIDGTLFRTNKAKIISIDGANVAYSPYNLIEYHAGNKITIYDFDCEYNLGSATGINFFMTREEAENYN